MSAKKWLHEIKKKKRTRTILVPCKEWNGRNPRARRG
jgi:hypothetical protein